MKSIILVLALLASAGIALAADISLSVNQSEYYFLVGEEAVVDIRADSSKKMDGTLSYTITQNINQGNFQYSSTNSRSTPFSVQTGQTNIPISFGTADTPMTLSIELEFSYGDEDLVLDFFIHFVADDSQKNNQQNPVSSQSQQPTQMQQMMDEMFQQPQQSVQNNQMAQDSSALRQQIENQLKDDRAMKQEFQKNLGNNQEFQKKHQEMLDEGYNLTSGTLDPETNTTGEFSLNYEKDGQTRTLGGKMVDNKIEQMNIQMTKEELMEQLIENEDFQRYDQQLREEGFQQLDAEVNSEGNLTALDLPYRNKENETAAIKAKFEDDKIGEVVLERKKSYWWILWIAALSLATYLLSRKKQEQPEIKQEPTDYKKEAFKILEKAKALFKDGRSKDAYGKAAESIRFYYSYRIGSKTEITNSELIKLLKKKGIPYTETQQCLNLCSMVEFAKYKANRKDFDRIISSAEKIIK